MTDLKNLLWAIRRFGFFRILRYEALRLRRQRRIGRSYDPAIDRAPLIDLLKRKQHEDNRG